MHVMVDQIIFRTRATHPQTDGTRKIWQQELNWWWVTYSGDLQFATTQNTLIKLQLHWRLERPPPRSGLVRAPKNSSRLIPFPLKKQSEASNKWHEQLWSCTYYQNVNLEGGFVSGLTFASSTFTSIWGAQTGIWWPWYSLWEHKSYEEAPSEEVNCVSLTSKGKNDTLKMLWSSLRACASDRAAWTEDQ